MGESMADLAIEMGLDEEVGPDYQSWENSSYNYNDSLGCQISNEQDNTNKVHKRLHKYFKGTELRNTKSTLKTILEMFGIATKDNSESYGWDVNFKVIKVLRGKDDDENFRCYICENNQYKFSITYRKALPYKDKKISKKLQARVKFLDYVYKDDIISSTDNQSSLVKLKIPKTKDEITESIISKIKKYNNLINKRHPATSIMAQLGTYPLQMHGTYIDAEITFEELIYANQSKVYKESPMYRNFLVTQRKELARKEGFESWVDMREKYLKDMI